MQDGMNKYFKEADEPRSKRNQKHRFITLVGTTLLAYLPGIDSYSGISDFTEPHYEELGKYFAFPGGVASHDTYQRLWDAINPEQFLSAFILLKVWYP